MYIPTRKWEIQFYPMLRELSIIAVGEKTIGAGPIPWRIIRLQQIISHSCDKLHDLLIAQLMLLILFA